MPALPSLTQAFSALGKAFNVPSASSFSSSVFAPPKTSVSPLSIGAPAVPNMSMAPKAPATPNMSVAKPAPNMSTVNGPVYSPPPTITPAANMSKPAVPQIAPATTSTTNQPAVPSTSTSPYIKTPSGAVVDPNTGALISGAPSGTLTAAGDTSENSPAVPQAYGNYSSYGGGTPGGGGTSYDPMITSPAAEAAFQNYESSLVPSQDELDTMKRLNDLNASSQQAYTDTQNKPIPLEFITGQQAALQRSQSALSTPLTNTLSLLQAKRQMASTASKAALDRLDAQTAAKRELAKPVSTAYGGTTSRYNPQTGQYETIVNPFGSASGTANGTSSPNISDIIGQAIADGRITSDQVTRYGIPFIAATLEKDPGYNFITQKASVTADTASLKTQQLYADSTDRAFKTANANLAQLVGYMQSAGVNMGSTVPAINELQNKVKAGVSDPGTIAAFQAALAGLRAEYAQVLSRGGEVTEGQRAQAASLIPDNLTPAQLQQVTDRLNIEGTNAVKEAQQKVSDIQTRLKSNPGGSSGSSSSSSAVPSGWSW